MDEEYSGEITGKQLQRNPDEYIGQKVKFTGECFMVSENNGVTLIGINTEDERVLVQGEISSDQLEQRVLERDKVTLYGIFEGLDTSAVSDGVVKLSIDKVEIN